MKKLFSVLFFSLLNVQVMYAQEAMTPPEAPQGIIVRVEKDSKQTQVFQVTGSTEKLNDKTEGKAELEKIVKDLSANTTVVEVKKSLDDEFGERSQTTASWGYWRYHRPYYYVGSVFGYFPSYSYNYYYNTQFYNYNYYPYNYVNYNNYYYYYYRPVYYCQPHYTCWY